MIYVSAFSQDPRRNRLFVYTVFTLEITQTIILTKSYFEIFASGFGDPGAYDRTGAIWFSVPFMSGIGLYLSFPVLYDCISDKDLLYLRQWPFLWKYSTPLDYISYLSPISSQLSSPWCVFVRHWHLRGYPPDKWVFLWHYIASGNSSRWCYIVCGDCERSAAIQPSAPSSI